MSEFEIFDNNYFRNDLDNLQLFFNELSKSRSFALKAHKELRKLNNEK